MENNICNNKYYNAAPHQTQSFDIRNFLDKLQPAKQKNKYYCPVCSGNDLEIEPQTGKYSCFHGCNRRDIREALKPWAEVLEEGRKHYGRVVNTPPVRSYAPPQKPVPLPQGQLTIARLSEVPIDSPQPTKAQVTKGIRAALEQKRCSVDEIKQTTVTTYDYGNDRLAYRFQAPCSENSKGYDKTFMVSHVDDQGETIWKKGNTPWSAYRQDEAIAAALAVEDGCVPVILVHEGEKCTEVARSQKLASISAQGTPSENDWLSILNDIKTRMGDTSGTLRERPFIIAYLRDNDDPGKVKARILAQAAIKSQVPVITVDPALLKDDLCHKGDIVDILGDGMNGDRLAELILEQIEHMRLSQSVDNSFGEATPVVNGEVVYSEDERLRLAILDLSQEKNKIAFIRKRATICSHYRISKAEIEELIKEIERKTLTNSLQRSSLDDLLDMEIQELNWLIPELLPAGEMVILGGSPKSGKTLMAIDAAFAIATGEDDFLGLRPQRGKVLLISNDENARSTKSKLIKRGFRSGDGKNLEIIFNWNIAQMYELEQVLDDFRPDVVIIDSLKSITAHNAEISENSAEFANSIYTLKNLLNQYNAASILIHHTSKNKEAMGVAKLRGSSAIAGAVWGTWQLDHIPKPDPNNSKGLIIDPTDPRRILSVFARDVEGQLLALEFDPENNSYARTDKEAIKEQNTMTDRILSVLKLNPHGLSGRDIIEGLGMTRQEGGRSIYTTLNRMEAKLLVSTIKSPSDKRVTLYILQSRQHVNVTDCKLVNKGGDSLSPPPRVQNVDYSSESYTQQCLQDSQQKNQISQQHTENSQQLFDTKTTEDYLKTTPHMGSSELVNIVNTGGGERESQKLLTISTECQEKQADSPVSPTEKRSEDDNNESTFALKVGEAKRHLQVGDSVQCLRDGYDAAWGCQGVVLGEIFSDFEIEWTRNDGTSFRRREESTAVKRI